MLTSKRALRERIELDPALDVGKIEPDFHSAEVRAFIQFD
jgi:hypothetical protein